MRFHSKSKEARKEWSRGAHAAKARKRMEGTPPDLGPGRLPPGAFLGVLAWTEASGQVRRWVVSQGPRVNNVCVRSKGKSVVCGWDHLLASLRKKLSAAKIV